ncbi:YjzC family protein [Burkholderia glumae]|uniref:YjzC family protein n=1 Tax=Burkholderia glumae TaxID=337 RepID=UPI0021515B52|nr:YjzC family protein [Burkholderia glumae]
MAKAGDIFKPGDKVPHSGIYTVIHDKEHIESHDVTCVYGKVFPPCKGCGAHPRFKLKYAAQHISANDNFS